MGYFARIGDDIRQWVATAAGLGANPIAEWFMLLDRRRESRLTAWSRYSPLIIALLPTVTLVGLGFYDKYMYGGNDLASFMRWAVFAFVVTAYLVWMAKGMYSAILDSMAMLNRSTKPTSSLSLDDLMLLTTVSDREIVVAAMRLIAPQLLIKTVVGIALMLLVYLYALLGLWDPGGWQFVSMRDEAILAVVLSPLTIISVAIPAVLGTLAGLLYYFGLGEGRTMVPASIASIVVILGQWLWLSAGTGIVFAINMDGMFSDRPDKAWYLFSVALSALVYLGLLALTLKAAAAARNLRSLFAIGTPILFHTLASFAFIFTITFSLFGFDYYYENNYQQEIISIGMGGFFPLLGSMLPLNPTCLPVFSMIGVDMDYSFYNIHVRMLAYPLLIIIQLVSVLLCANHAALAVKRRRQSNNA